MTAAGSCRHGPACGGVARVRQTVALLLAAAALAFAGCSAKKQAAEGAAASDAADAAAGQTNRIVTGRFVRFEDSAIVNSIFVCDSTYELQRIVCRLDALPTSASILANRLVRVVCRDTTFIDGEDSVTMKAALSVSPLAEPKRRAKPQGKGLGIISLADAGAELDGFVFPTQALDAYDSPGGRPVGQFLFADNEVEERTPHLMTRDTLTELASEDIEEIDYETYAVRYYADSAGFIRIGARTRKPGLWVRTSSLAAAGYAPLPWQDFLLKHACAFPIVEDACGSLRSAPADTAATLTRMLGDGFQLRFTGEREGAWMRATLEHNDGYCGGGTIYRTWIGWVRVIDDAGNPLVWFYPRGC